MGDKELQQQKYQAELDGWKAEADKLKAKLSGSAADAQIEAKKQLEALEAKIEEGKSGLAELLDDAEDAWGSAKDKAGAARDAAKSTVSGDEQESED
ncbi:MAG: coiled coil domain-containing protein [Coriobacteriia bacterium]|nr:coiled coil domain-containing protein [Coriobacteriia bacterium]